MRKNNFHTGSLSHGDILIAGLANGISGEKHELRLHFRQRTPPETYSRHKSRSKFPNLEMYLNWVFARAIWSLENSGLIQRIWHGKRGRAYALWTAVLTPRGREKAQCCCSGKSNRKKVSCAVGRPKRHKTRRVKRAAYFDVGSILRRLLVGHGWTSKSVLRTAYRVSVPPEYFTRAAFRRSLDVESYKNWAFSRDVKDLVRRGQAKRRWIGEPGKPGSDYKLKLTAKGGRLL